MYFSRRFQMKKGVLLLFCMLFTLSVLLLAPTTPVFLRTVKNGFKEKAFEKEGGKRRLLDGEMLARRCGEMKTKETFPRESMKSEVPYELIYNQQQRMLVCLVDEPDIGAWRQQFGNFTHFQNKTFENVSELRQKLNALKADKQTVVVATGRHPLQNLVSVYENEFKNGVTSAFLLEELQRHRRSQRLNENSEVFSFEEFLGAVATSFKVKGRSGVNPLLRPSSALCRPCSFNYDLALFTDTFPEDLRTFARRLGLQDIDIEALQNIDTARTRQKSYEGYFEDVSPELLQEIYNIYKEDFFLFGYDLPPAMRSSIKGAR